MTTNKNQLLGTAGRIFLLLTLWVLPTFAQQEKGDKELQLQGFFQVQFGESKSVSGLVATNFGYFFTDRQEAGVGTISFFGGNTDDFTFTLGVTSFYRYHFGRKKGKLFPYAGVDLVVADLLHEGRTDGILVRPNLGFKYFFKRNVAVDINSGYGFAIKEAKSGAADTRLGISYIF